MKLRAHLTHAEIQAIIVAHVQQTYPGVTIADVELSSFQDEIHCSVNVPADRKSVV
jgi:hypothetical protein